MKKKVRPHSTQSEYVAHSKELTKGKKAIRSKKVTGTKEETQLEEVTTIEEATQTEEVTVAEEVTQTEVMAQKEEMVQTEDMETAGLSVTVTHSERQGGLRRSGSATCSHGGRKHGFLPISMGMFYA